MKPATAAPQEAATQWIALHPASDLFHQVNQPLTTLCCSMELALIQAPTAEEYRTIVAQALNQAEKAAALATAIQELFDPTQAGEAAEFLDLRQAVQEAIVEWLPVAESARSRVVRRQTLAPAPVSPPGICYSRRRAALTAQD